MAVGGEAAGGEEHEEQEGLAATFHEKVISLHTMDPGLLAPTAVAIAIIVASGVLLVTRDAAWPLVSTGEIAGTEPARLPLPVAVLTTITLILAWSFILTGALHAHPVLRVVAVGCYSGIGLFMAVLTGSGLFALVVALIVLSVVVASIGLYVTDRGNHHQAPHLHHRARLRFPTFGWVLLATTLLYVLFVVRGLQDGQFGSFVDLQLLALQVLLIPILTLAGTDFAEWAEVASGRLGALVEKLGRGGMVGAIAVAGVAVVVWFVVFRDGGSLRPVGVLETLAPVAMLAVGAIGVGVVAVRRPTSTRVPFWAPVVGVVLLYLGTDAMIFVPGVIAPSVAAVILVGLGLVLLVRGRGEVATGGLFLALTGLFIAAGPLVLGAVIQQFRVPLAPGAAPYSLDLAGALGALGVVAVTSIVPGWRLGVPVLRLVFVLVLGLAALHFLFSGVFETALSEGRRFTVIQGLVLMVAMLWDVLMSGESFTNTGGPSVPRHSRVLIYFGYTMLVVTAVLYLSSLRYPPGAEVVGQEFESDLWPQIGLYAVGTPLLITFFTINLGRGQKAPSVRTRALKPAG